MRHGEFWYSFLILGKLIAGCSVVTCGCLTTQFAGLNLKKSRTATVIYSSFFRFSPDSDMIIFGFKESYSNLEYRARVIFSI